MKKPSLRGVLNALEGESNSTEDDRSSFGDSTMSGSPPRASNFKGQSCIKKQMSPLRKRKDSLNNKEKEQPLMKCFSYEDISNATNNFHPGKSENSIVTFGGIARNVIRWISKYAKLDARKEKSEAKH